MFKKTNNIFRRILIPLLILAVAQAGLIYGAVQASGSIQELEHNSFDIFRERVAGRKTEFENSMIQRWSDLEEPMSRLDKTLSLFLASHETDAAGLLQNDVLINSFLSTASEDLIYLLRRNNVTASFLILNQQETAKKTGLYFRDPDPGSNPADYSDLQISLSPSAIPKQLGIAMESYWTPQFTLEPGQAQNAFFYNPLSAAQEHPEFHYEDCGYWSKAFVLHGLESGNSEEIITYSVPFRAQDGTIVGVLGIELSADYLKKRIPYKELNFGSKGGYMIAVCSRSALESGNAVLSAEVKNCPYILQQLGTGNNTLEVQRHIGQSSFYQIGEPLQGAGIIGCIEPFTLYNTHTPFEDDQWVLIGIVPQEALLSFSNQFHHLIIIVCLVFILLAFAGIIVAARIIARPIATLVLELRDANPARPIVLEHVHIAEIDELADAVQNLSSQVADSAHKLSQILQLAGVPVGAFEYRASQPEQIFCTDQLFSILNWEDIDCGENAYLETKEFKKRMSRLHRLSTKEDNSSSFIYKIGLGQNERFVRLRLVRGAEQVIGVITDSTQEVYEKQKIEHDRDYDMLTNLYNRRAFLNHIHDLFTQPEALKTAALVMIDLDNLKQVNDTYGHDYGDKYIRAAATAFKAYSSETIMAARLAGDEFVIFFHGYATQKEIRRIWEQLQDSLQAARIVYPDGSDSAVHASAGIAWYPDDAKNYEDLMRFADFAMYNVKRARKGQAAIFGMGRYNQDAYLLHCKEELETILSFSLVDYQFQPIVSAANGDIFAFEALMRPRSQSIKGPTELLSLARSQGSLQQVERLTFFRAMECFLEQGLNKNHQLVFIKSLSNQVLSAMEVEKFEEDFQSYLNLIVFELSQAEECNADLTTAKRETISRWNASMSLSDFGTGCSSETFFLDFHPEYIKLDLSLVRNVHRDINRRHMLHNLIQYAHEHGARVIAAGIEQREELQILLEEGADFLQGYYLCKPSYRPMKLLEEKKQEICAFHQHS